MGSHVLIRHVSPWLVEREASLLKVIAQAADPETGAQTAEDVRGLLQGGLDGFFEREGQIVGWGTCLREADPLG